MTIKKAIKILKEFYCTGECSKCIFVNPYTCPSVEEIEVTIEILERLQGLKI